MLKKQLFTLLFFQIISFSQAQVNCSLFKVKDVIIDNSNFTIEIGIYNGDTNHLNYPYIAYTVDSFGDTLHNGNINLSVAPALDTTWFSYALAGQSNIFYPLNIYFVNSSDTCVLPYHPSCNSVSTYFNNIDSSSTTTLINFSVETLGFGIGNFGYCGFVLFNELGDTVALETMNTAGNVFGLMEFNTETRILEVNQNVNLPFHGKLHLVNGWFAGNPVTSCIFPFAINSITSKNKVRNINNKVIKVIDILGRKTEIKSNMLLLYIYENGKTEKKIHI